MKFFTHYRYLLVGILLGAGVVFLVSSFTTEKRLSQLQVSLEDSIDLAYDEVRQALAAVEDGGQSGSVSMVIADCTSAERDIFESYLARLDSGLTVEELNEVDVLFSRCAPVQSVRRALVTMDLARRFEKFDALVEQRKQIGSFTEYDSARSTLQDVVALEEDVTQLSFDLVFLQREIIDALLTGESVYSEKSNDFKARGAALRMELATTAEEAIKLRLRI